MTRLSRYFRLAALYIAWAPHRLYWRGRRLMGRPAVVIGLTDPDGVQREELHVYSGCVERRPRRRA